MDQNLEYLIEEVEEEIRLWEAMHGLLLQKEKAVVDARIDRLNQVGEQIKILQSRIGEAANQRKNILGHVSRTLGCAPADLSLKNLSTMVGEPYGSRLADCRSQFFRLVGGVQDINTRVRSLLSHAIELVGTSFNVLNGLMAPHTVYGHSGMTESRNESGRILSRSI